MATRTTKAQALETLRRHRQERAGQALAAYLRAVHADARRRLEDADGETFAPIQAEAQSARTMYADIFGGEIDQAE